jgi:hypothetical protein
VSRIVAREETSGDDPPRACERHLATITSITGRVQTVDTPFDMRSVTFQAIMFVLMTLIGAMSMFNYRNMRRAAVARPDDPRIARMMRIKWVFIVGIICSLVAAANALRNWIALS